MAAPRKTNSGWCSENETMRRIMCPALPGRESISLLRHGLALGARRRQDLLEEEVPRDDRLVAFLQPRENRHAPIGLAAGAHGPAHEGIGVRAHEDVAAHAR